MLDKNIGNTINSFKLIPKTYLNIAIKCTSFFQKFAPNCQIEIFIRLILAY